MHWGSSRSDASKKPNTKVGVVGRPFSRTTRPGRAAGESSRRIGFASRVHSNIPMNYDRKRLETLRLALGASSLALRYDQTRGGERGDLGLRGKYGQIYIDAAGFLLCVSGIDKRIFTARRWSVIKKRLAFCRLTQDGDCEGCLHLDHLPSKREAAAVRAVLGIKKRRSLSAEGLAQLQAARIAAGEGPQRAGSAEPFRG
jgi:hypothetical protein